jgi:hypothetical protein
VQVQVRRDLHAVRQARQPPRRRGEAGEDEGAQGVLELEDGLGGGVEDEVWGPGVEWSAEGRWLGGFAAMPRGSFGKRDGLWRCGLRPRT